jgi:RNA polymerase sigma-70 factor, ECF subfamily
VTSMTPVDGCQGEAHATFDDVLARYQADIYRFAVQLTRDRVAANDLYQETLLKAFNAFDELDRPANYRSWLFTIATTAFLSHRRLRTRRVSPGDEQALEVRGAPPDDTDRLDAHALLREVEACVADLPREQWVALVGRKYFDLGYSEIAATLCCSEVSARASVHEAVRAMRVRVGDRL